MTSPPLDTTHGRQRWAWHNISAVGQHTQSDEVERGMTSQSLDSTHSQTTSGVTCHYRLWTAHTLERRQSWHAIISVGPGHTVGRLRAWHAIIAFGQHTQSNDVGLGMTSPPLDNTHVRTTSGVTCHHRLLTAHSVERREVWHAIIAIG